jgi:hypothetical protein
LKTLDLSILPAEAWRPVEPVTGRSSNRISEREFERIPARLCLSTDGPGDQGVQPEKAEGVPVAMWDFSLFGFALLRDHVKTASLQLKEGDRVRLSVDFGDGWVGSDCVVRNLSIVKGRQRIGLARLDLTRASGPAARLGIPQGECIRLADTLDIRAEAVNPIFFGEWSDLRLAGLQPGLKLDFITRDAALPLFKGQRLDVHLILPTSGDNRYRGEITALERIPGGSVRIRMNPVSLSHGLATDLAESLACDAGFNPDMLKRFGFPTRFFRNRITFRFVESMEDYEKVLTLRRNAYVEVGKRDAETAPEEMSIAWDKTSRILCAYHDDLLVASAAMTFPRSESETLRSETAFPGNRFPGDPPPKSELLEVNSLCTHKDFRRGDLLHAVFEQIARIFILSDRKYIMNLSDANLLPMYLGIGFKDQRETGTFLGRPHHLIKVSRDTVLKSEGLNLLRWSVLYGDLMEDVLAKRMLPMSAWERLALKARLAVKPLADWIRWNQGERTVRRHIDENKEM